MAIPGANSKAGGGPQPAGSRAGSAQPWPPQAAQPPGRGLRGTTAPPGGLRAAQQGPDPPKFPPGGSLAPPDTPPAPYEPPQHPMSPPPAPYEPIPSTPGLQRAGRCPPTESILTKNSCNFFIFFQYFIGLTCTTAASAGRSVSVMAC